MSAPLKKHLRFPGVLLLFCLINTGYTHAQEKVEPNALVKEAYSPTELNGILATDPNSILYYNYLTEKAWCLTNVPEEKSEVAASYPLLYKKDPTTKVVTQEPLSAKDLLTFNLLQYDYRIAATPTYYRIADSKQILVIKSQDEINAGFNRFKK